jgi:hypothetical protein
MGVRELRQIAPRAGFKTSAALGPFKYATLTPRKKNLIIISNKFI